jgi:hypothetical protein
MRIGMTNPRVRTDRVGSRYQGASETTTSEPPYLSEVDGRRWLSSGLPEEKRTLRSQITDFVWLLIFPLFFTLCVAAVLAVGAALNGILDWLSALLFVLAASAAGAAYIVAGRRLGLA